MSDWFKTEAARWYHAGGMKSRERHVRAAGGHSRPRVILALTCAAQFMLILDLVVEVGVQAGQYLAARHLVRLAAAHSASFPGSSPAGDASAGAVDAARTRPSLAA